MLRDTRVPTCDRGGRLNCRTLKKSPHGCALCSTKLVRSDNGMSSRGFNGCRYRCDVSGIRALTISNNLPHVARIRPTIVLSSLSVPSACPVSTRSCIFSLASPLAPLSPIALYDILSCLVDSCRVDSPRVFFELEKLLMLCYQVVFVLRWCPFGRNGQPPMSLSLYWMLCLPFLLEKTDFRNFATSLVLWCANWTLLKSYKPILETNLRFYSDYFTVLFPNTWPILQFHLKSLLCTTSCHIVTQKPGHVGT